MAPSPTVLHRRARLGTGGVAAALLAALLGVSLIGVPAASGDPISDAQAQAAMLARRINDEGQQVEILAEQFDGARVHADQVNAQLVATIEKMAAARATAARTHAALATEAVDAYIHGGYVSVPGLSAYSASDDLSVEKGYFDFATNNQADVVGKARAAEAQLKVEQGALQVAQAEASAAMSSLAAKQKAVQLADAATRQTLSQVQGQLVQLVAAQQAQMAAEQQAQEQAVLAAQVSSQSPSITATTVAHPPTTVARVTATPATRPPSTATKAPSSTAAIVRTTVARTTPVAPTIAPPTTAPPPPKPTPPPAPLPSSRGAAAAIAFAQSQIGKAYEFGAAGPDTWDCSGLTMMAWNAGGVSLVHYAAAQYADTTHIPVADLQPGDLVFFGSDLHHVGIYVGGGQMIDAPHTGTLVRYDTIFWPDLQPFGGRPG